MTYLRALLLTESGRPNKAILPPRTTRLIPTGTPTSGPCFVVATDDLMKRSIMIPFTILEPSENLEVFLYNGSHETHYVSHGDVIAHIFPYKVSR